MTVLPSKHYSGHHKAAEEEGQTGTLGEEIWRRKAGLQTRDLRIVFLRSNRISNRIGRPIRFRIEFSNRIGRIYHASRNTV